MAWFSGKEDPNKEIYKAYPWLKSTTFPWIESHDRKVLKKMGLSWSELKDLAVDYATSNLDAPQVEGALAAHIDGVSASISLENSL